MTFNSPPLDLRLCQQLQKSHFSYNENTEFLHYIFYNITGFVPQWYLNHHMQRKGNLKKTAFWDIALCSLEVDRRFRGVYCLHNRPGKGGSTQLWNVSLLQRDDKALYPKRLSPSYPPSWELEIAHEREFNYFSFSLRTVLERTMAGSHKGGFLIYLDTR
jgi:hypothetical protein